MNYIVEILAFERWLETNYLSTITQLLWYKLMWINNRCMWQEWFSVTNLRLMGMISVNDKRTLEKAKKELVENNLIEIEQGHKGQPDKYKLIQISNIFCTENDEKMQNKSIDKNIIFAQNDTKNASKMYPINKQKHKQKQNINTHSQSECLTVQTADGTENKTVHHTKTSEIAEMFDLFWRAYPKKVGKKAAQKSFEKLKPDKILLDKMLEVIEKCRKTEQWNTENGRYIPNPTTWLNQGRWDDELPEVQNTPPSIPNTPDRQKNVKPSSFSNFEQRDYDNEDFSEWEDTIINFYEKEEK